MNEFPIFLFNHGSLLNYLSKAESSPLGGEEHTLVELGATAYLAHFTGLQTPANFPGVAAALNQETTLGELSIKIPDCPHSLILAPGERVSEAAIADAWQKIGQLNGESLVGLISTTEAPGLVARIESECPITLFWDVDYPPTADTDWANVLAAYLRERPQADVWQGIRLYSGSSASRVSVEDDSCPPPLRELSEVIQRLNTPETFSAAYATT